MLSVVSRLLKTLSGRRERGKDASGAGGTAALPNGKMLGHHPLPKLQLLHEGNVVQEWELDAPELVIGRQPGVDIQLDDQTVSRRHAGLRRGKENAYVLSDLDSKNGTFVNGKRVTCPLPLSDGDLLSLGSSCLRYLVPASFENS